MLTEYTIVKIQQETNFMKTMKHYFTLVEILTVAAIIAILAGISVGVIGLISNKNAEAKTQATIKALELALGQFKTENGHVYIPGGATNLNKTVRLTIPKLSSLGDASLNGTLLKYLDQKLVSSATKEHDTNNLYFVDAWGRPLIFRMPGKFNKTGFDLGSVGADGKVGEDGTDITDTVPNPITNYETKFGKGDDITNFLRN